MAGIFKALQFAPDISKVSKAIILTLLEKKRIQST